ncbi:AI-2E family transporter [Microlunatus sp. Gsoil 973]|uniref:AI-2E family transporter n=1 Tax=Microlunatus sp. Gsoil 973 TaxID=2672569 RepID=UPI0012B4DE69|nr:AI-2E family transporter [Microlunatus sp. Gsoil 973]QGN33511.1 AI-2E family transporter [Microlunatus sp. Gsoil 973]
MANRSRLGIGRMRRPRRPVDEPAGNPDAGRSPGVADPPEPPPSDQELIEGEVPWGFRVAASWAWRLIIIAAMVAGIGWVLRYLSEVTIPIAIAILLAALISPVANFFNRRRFPRALSAALSMIIGVVLVSGTVTLIATQIADQAEGMGTKVADGFSQLTDWLANGPLNVPQEFLQIDKLTDQVREFPEQQ